MPLRFSGNLSLISLHALLVFAFVFVFVSRLSAQNLAWTMQESGTTAGLRGIYSVDGKIAWASGTGGTVLRTIDGGEHWQKCAVPDAATDGATMDFRGVQAWDATIAIAMASGPGEKSRLYKTVNGCQSWKLLFRNPDKSGFWDTLSFQDKSGWLLGDPVNGAFTLFASEDSGKHWIRQRMKGVHVDQAAQGAFAASNSSLITGIGLIFGSGGKEGAFSYSISETEICLDDCPNDAANLDGAKNKWKRVPIPIGIGTEASGAFSLASQPAYHGIPFGSGLVISVGGDFTKPNESLRTAAWSADSGRHWTTSTQPPHGYRSSVACSEELKAWITVGTNGSDISRDDGKTWQPMDDGNWNALSLPFVVGPKGRIGRLAVAGK